MNYQREYSKFSKWWEETTKYNDNWTTLERLAAKDAWIKRALIEFERVNGAETKHKKALYKQNVSQQRELLNDFSDKFNKQNELFDKPYIDTEDIENYLKGVL
jgi:hypothetical protein